LKEITKDAKYGNPSRGGHVRDGRTKHAAHVVYLGDAGWGKKKGKVQVT